MKRSELKRTVGLKRTEFTKRTTGALKRSAKLKPRSDKMELVYVERRQLVGQFLEMHPVCEIRWEGICWSRATCVHERLSRGRSGNTEAVILDPELFMAACGPCNTHVDDDPIEAERRGFLWKSTDPRAAKYHK